MELSVGFNVPLHTALVGASLAEQDGDIDGLLGNGSATHCFDAGPIA